MQFNPDECRQIMTIWEDTKQGYYLCQRHSDSTDKSLTPKGLAIISFMIMNQIVSKIDDANQIPFITEYAACLNKLIQEGHEYATDGHFNSGDEQ